MLVIFEVPIKQRQWDDKAWAGGSRSGCRSSLKMGQSQSKSSTECLDQPANNKEHT